MSVIRLVGVLAVCLFARGAFAAYGVDVSQSTSVSAFQCMGSNGFNFAIARVYRSTGSPDPNGPQTISNAWSAGFAHVDGYIFPCPTCGNPAGQMQAAVSALQNAGARFGQLWLDIEGSQYWMGQSANQQFFEGLVSAGQSLGVSLGVYTSASQWEPIMGSSYSGGSSLPLWYAHYDGSTSFSDFSPFGGWSSPAMKQYSGDNTLCGAGVDKNWYP